MFLRITSTGIGTNLMLCAMVLTGCAKAQTPAGDPRGLAQPSTPQATWRFEPADGEFRGSWVHWEDYVSPEVVAATVAKAKRANLNVLLPLANYPHQAMWLSQTLPTNPRVPAGFNPLAALAVAAHQQGIEVHPYLIMLNGGLTKHPGLQPEWYVVGRDGQRIGGWLNAAHPGVRQFLTGLVAEVAATGVDGISFDYIRHEDGKDYDYGPWTREAFRGAAGFDPLQATDARSKRIWNEWRTAQVTELVRQCAAMARAVKPDIIVSAAGGTRAIDIGGVHRDGKTWLERGYVDFVLPMAYNRQLERLQTRLQSELEPLRGTDLGQRLFPGIAAFWLEDDPQAVVNQVNATRAAGLRGMCFFAFEHVNDNIIGALTGGPFAQPAAVPWRMVELAQR